MCNVFNVSFARTVTEEIDIGSYDMNLIIRDMVDALCDSVHDIVDTAVDLRHWPTEARQALVNAVMVGMSKKEHWERE